MLAVVVPLGQGLQVVTLSAPRAELYVLSGQGRHEVAPSKSEYVPAAHLTQAKAPAIPA